MRRLRALSLSSTVLTPDKSGKCHSTHFVWLMFTYLKYDENTSQYSTIFYNVSPALICTEVPGKQQEINATSHA